MDQIINAASRVYFTGTQDLSGKLQNVPAENLPQFLAKMYTFAEMGSTEPIFMEGSALGQLYGWKTVDRLSKYYTHQLKTAELIMTTSSVILQRVVPEDAETASMTVYVIVKKGDYVLKKRNSNGRLVVPYEDSSDTVPGVKIGFSVANGVHKDVITIDDDTKAYPVISQVAKFPGAKYNDFGLSIEQLTSGAVSEKFKTKDGFIPVRLTLNEKVGSKAKRKLTLAGAPGVVGTFMSDKRNPITTKEAYFGYENFEKQYFNTDSVLLPYVMDVCELEIHEANYREIYEVMAEVEAPLVNNEVKTWADGRSAATSTWFDYSVVDDDSKHLMNPFSGESTDGVPYMATEIDTTGIYITDTGTLPPLVNFGPNSPVFMTGGTDGTMNEDTYNAAVSSELARYEDIMDPVLDIVTHPESVFIDTGYPFEVKEDFCKVLTKRPDVSIVFSTITENDRRKSQTLPEMMDAADIIMNRLKLYPESTYYNTDVTRAIIVGGNGELIDGSYSGKLSLNYSLISKLKEYMGAGNYRWDANKRFDIAPGNVIRDMYRISPKHIPDVILPILQTKQLTWAKTYNTKLYQFPAVQTVNPDDSSTLNGALTMFAIGTLTKIGVAAHKEYTGSMRLSPSQIKERVESYVTGRVNGIFDGSFVITPLVYYTAADVNRQYSWTLEIKIESSFLMTVETLIITADSYQ